MNQRGTLSVEFALLVPALMLLFAGMVGGARVWMARATVEQLAGAAARGASLERTAAAAEPAARALAVSQAAVSGVRCAPLRVLVHAEGFSRPAGSPGGVTAEVTCAVPLGDILIPGWPGELTVRANASAILDTYRERR